MKKVLIFAMVSMVLFGCKKDDPKEVFHEKLIGSWILTEARLNPADPWVDVTASNDVFVITECTMNPYKPEYHVLNESTFEIPVGSNGDWQSVNVVFDQSCMIWTFEDNSQLKLCE